MRSFRLLPIALLAGCVYFNAMYDANREYDAGLASLQEQATVTARVQFDSVIAKTGRIVEGHPDSKYADDAAILKTRAELHNQNVGVGRRVVRQGRRTGGQREEPGRGSRLEGSRLP